MDACRNLVDMLERSCREGDKGITFVKGASDEVSLSYRDLYTRAKRVLGALQARGMRKGDELIFQVADNQAFIEVLWGCLMGGIIAVPITIGNNDERKLKIFKIWKVLNNPRLIAEETGLSNVRAFAAENGLTEAFEVIAKKTIRLEEVLVSDQEGELVEAQPTDIAYLQFSSGSTGDPKGVTLTHENLLFHMHQFTTSGEINDQDSFFSWMPLTHDMGLIGWHYVPLYNNLNQFIMPPSVFVADPTLWIKKAMEHKATILSSPNFGYKLFLDKFDMAQSADWDLSHIRLIFNAAEPINPDLCDQFLETLKPLGLKRTTMFNLYGLAEACLMVTFPPVGEAFVTWCVDRESLGVGHTVRELADRNHRNAVLFADVGAATVDMELRIADDEGRPVNDMVVGHIQIKSGSVTQGYYNNPEATARVMTADGWLDTGDLGFMRNGRMVITGRAKEVIFVNGQNYYAHDIERMLQHVGIQLGKVVACGVHNDVEKRDEIVLFVSHKKSLEEFVPVALDVKRLIAEKMGLFVGAVVPIPSVPKTTSGKYQRLKLRERYQNGQFDHVLVPLRELMAKATTTDLDVPLTETEQRLLALTHEVFGTTSIGVHDNLSYHGANSLLLTKLHALIAENFPGKATLSNLYSHLTVAKLAYFLDHGGSISLPTVSLPPAYLAKTRHDEGRVSLRLSLEGERYRRLVALGEMEAAGLNQILLAVFAHLLSEITGEPRVAIQALIGPVPDRIVSVELNLAEIDDVSDLFKQVGETCRIPAYAYVVQELGKVRLGKEATAVVPLLYAKSFLTTSARFMDVYDVVLEVEEGQGMAICTCEFDAGRLNKAKVAELLGQYVQMLDQLLDQYEVQETAVSGGPRE